MKMKRMFEHLEEDEILDLEQFQITPPIYNPFLYDIGDSVILRDEIKIGTISGGVEFEEVHKNAKYKVLTVKDSIIDEYGNYYITNELGDKVKVTDSMVDQIKTKGLHKWLKQDPLICIIGRTASGKDTLANKFVESGKTLIKTSTTRPRREGEGDTHKFVNRFTKHSNRFIIDHRAQVKRMAESMINGYMYFTTLEDVLSKDILIVDPIGFENLMRDPMFDRPVKVYYLVVDKSTRRGRFILRDKSQTSRNLKALYFRIRDKAEDEQFTWFETMLEDDEFIERHNITVMTSESRQSEPYYRELVWEPKQQIGNTVGFWVPNDKEVTVGPVRQTCVDLKDRTPEDEKEINDKIKDIVKSVGGIKHHEVKKVDGLINTHDLYTIGDYTISIPKDTPIGIAKKHPDDKDRLVMGSLISLKRMLEDSTEKGDDNDEQ